MIRHALLAIPLLSSACLDFEFSRHSGWDPPPGHDPIPDPDPVPPDPPVTVCGELRCAPNAPEGGLDFIGVQPVLGGYPNGAFSDIYNHIAVGGTHDVELRYAGTETLFDQPVVAMPLDPSLSVVALQDAQLRLSANSSTGGTLVRFADPVSMLGYDRYRYGASPLHRAEPVAAEELVTHPDWLSQSAPAFAFAPGARTIGIAFLSQHFEPHRLVDTSAVLELDGATQTRWDTLDHPDLAIGMHTVTATVGSSAPIEIEIEVTDQAASLIPLFTWDTIACFGAYTADGKFIAGLPYTFEIDGEIVDPNSGLGRNCIFNPSPMGGRFTVTASAGGQAITVTTM